MALKIEKEFKNSGVKVTYQKIDMDGQRNFIFIQKAFGTKYSITPCVGGMNEKPIGIDMMSHLQQKIQKFK